jgi:hypothetical protein
VGYSGQTCPATPQPWPCLDITALITCCVPPGSQWATFPVGNCMAFLHPSELPLHAHATCCSHLCPTCTLICRLLPSHLLQTRSSQGKQETLGSSLLYWRRKSDLGRGHFQLCLLWEFTLRQHFLVLSGNTFYERLELDDTKISLFNLQCNFISISGPN